MSIQSQQVISCVHGRGHTDDVSLLLSKDWIFWSRSTHETTKETYRMCVLPRLRPCEFSSLWSKSLCCHLTEPTFGTLMI